MIDMRHEGTSYYTRPSKKISCKVLVEGKWITNKEYLQKEGMKKWQ